MPRKPNPDTPRPGPEAAAAFERIRDTAMICAASLFGERPPEAMEDLSPEALRHAAGMMFFLCRIDPKDMAALSTGTGSFADFDHRPFPPGYHCRSPLFARSMAVVEPAM